MIEPNNDPKSHEQSLSTYASAETSPNPSITSSVSLQSIRSTAATNGESKLSPSISIASLLGQKSDSSIVAMAQQQTNIHAISMDDPSIVVSTNKPLTNLVPTSTSSNALDKLLRQGEYSSLNSTEYQSLPANILFENAKNKENPGKERQSIQELVKTTVKSLIESTVKSSVDEASKNNLLPLIKSTVSSSSPNPECSPFKLLLTEGPKSPSKLTATLSPNGSTIHEAVTAVFNSETKPKDDKVIESLAMLNHKEHEKADPILSASTKTVQTSTSVNSLSETNKPTELKNSPVKSTSTNSMSVPASSQEFCMSLNLNLAAAAAANASGPIVVCDNTKQTTSPKDQTHLSEHHRFTSNVSTSSIHNDLKMILEESKGQGSPTAVTDAEKENKKEEKKHQLKKHQNHKEKRLINIKTSL